ncbi:hypothetical protein TrCOL_g10281 [Triparma columacea]|uniref:DUF6697 domain-containing protein n=1 Tax=Triparma columacea TaxID=722753 RepID=A0A9W7FY32_9STRA|nr:hypothetical protein TrCOL_g10281 [Triparma columacea]
MGNSTPSKNAVVSEDSATTISPIPILDMKVEMKLEDHETGGQDFQALIKQEERGGEDRGDGQREERHEPVKVEMKSEDGEARGQDPQALIKQEERGGDDHGDGQREERRENVDGVGCLEDEVKIKKEPELSFVRTIKRQHCERTIHKEVGGNPQNVVTRTKMCKPQCLKSGKCCCDCKDFNIPKQFDPRISPKDQRNLYVYASSAFHPFAPGAQLGRTAKSGNIYGGTLFFPDSCLPDPEYDKSTSPTFPLFVQQYYKKQEGDTVKRLTGHWTYVGTFTKATGDDDEVEDVSTFASKFKTFPVESKNEWVAQLASESCTWGMAFKNFQADIRKYTQTEEEWKGVLLGLGLRPAEFNYTREAILNPGNMQSRKEITMKCLETGLLGCDYTSVKCVGFDEKFYNHIKENCDTYCFNLQGELIPDPDDNNSDDDVPASKKCKKSPISAPNVPPQPVQRRSREQETVSVVSPQPVQRRSREQEKAQDKKDREELIGKKVKVKWNDGKDYPGTIQEYTRTSELIDGRKIHYYDVFFEEEKTLAEVNDGDFVFL